MENTQTISIESEKISRPFGVWILTIYGAIFAGIIPLIAYILVFLSGSSPVLSGLNPLYLIFSIGLNIGITIFAIQTWMGKEKARKTFIVLISLNYLLLSINNFLIILSGQADSLEIMRLWGRVIRNLVYPALYIWYFNRSRTKEFFQN